MIEIAIRRTEAGHDLLMDEVVETFDHIMCGRCAEEDIARWLLALNRKGASVSELAGAAVALRRKMTPIRSSRPELLDTCGTGGDQLYTFNISTAAALVTAAAGVPVAKHGNRAASSRSGSADVLVVLGVNVEADVACVERCLDELGICFCFAPLLHNAMKHVAPVRKKLGVPTIFNILGPLINPAGATRQLLGVGRAKFRPLLAEALVLLGTARSAIVHGSDGLDEVTLMGITDVTEATGNVRHFQWTPADFGLGSIDLKSIQVTGPDQSAVTIRGVLAGQPGPARDIVVANAAAALWTAGAAPSPAAGAVLAARAIDTAAASDLLARLAARSHGK
ncbi:MAG: anthranilate phosphoribosyltransferase [Thermoguttaceae bacterium]|jgi:anthranilate phosphoribosyltransferase